MHIKEFKMDRFSISLITSHTQKKMYICCNFICQVFDLNAFDFELLEGHFHHCGRNNQLYYYWKNEFKLIWKYLQALDLFEERGNENSGPEFLSITYAKYLRLLCKNYIPDVDCHVFFFWFVPL